MLGLLVIGAFLAIEKLESPLSRSDSWSRLISELLMVELLSMLGLLVIGAFLAIEELESPLSRSDFTIESSVVFWGLREFIFKAESLFSMA